MGESNSVCNIIYRIKVQEETMDGFFLQLTHHTPFEIQSTRPVYSMRRQAVSQ